MSFTNSHNFRIIWSSFLSNPKISNILKNQKLFDVTLRDGLQSLSKEQVTNFTLQNKKDLYNIIKKYNSQSYFEVGSLVSPKVLPIMNESLDLYRWCFETSKTNNHFLLIPSSSKLTKENMSICKNYSFITSVSEGFQQKNLNKSLVETKEDIFTMTDKINSSYTPRDNFFIKLYVSCINECPIDGRLDNDYIIKELAWNYNAYKPNLLCISDTCGTLETKDFKYIIDGILNNGVPPDKLSLHLHVNSKNENETINIIHNAFDRNILNFDVSSIESGGCSVTMDPSKMNSNLTYNLYYNALFLYKMYKK